MIRGAPRTATLALGALGLLLAGCRSVGARVHNLGELHSGDGFHKSRAVLMGDFEWQWRSGWEGLLGRERLATKEKKPKKVDDPTEACLRNLVKLQRAYERGPTDLSTKIAQLARYGVECPWHLSRERCVIGMSWLGRRLALDRHPPPLLEGQPVGAEQLGAALNGVLVAVRPALEQRGGGTSGSDLAAACERVRGLPYDLAGARRALSFVALLLRGAPASATALEPLRTLHVDLQRLTVHRALTAALRDELPFERSGTDPGWPSPRVRAAALEALVQLFGEPALAEFLVQLDPRTEPELLVALLRAVAERGLPSGVPGVPPDEEAQWRERWIDTILGIALQHPEGRVRVAGMRALSRISGGELASLREEQWILWSQRRAARERPAGTGTEPPRVGPAAPLRAGAP